MRQYFWNAPFGNFGDDLNAWLWDELLPGFESWPSKRTLLGVGSLLTTNLLSPEQDYLVLGSGAGYGQAPPASWAARWDVRCVRGPRTAAALGLPEATAITDAAVLLPSLARFRNVPAHGAVVFVPHWQAAVHPDYDWAAMAEAAGVTLVSPCGDAATVIRRIAGARLVLAESLHAAIVADAFRVPWRPVRTGAAGFNRFKWQDWTDGMEVALEVTDLFHASRAPRGALNRLRRTLGSGARQAASAETPAPARQPSADEYLSGLPRSNLPSPLRRARDAVRRTEAALTLRRAAQLSPFLSADRVLARCLERYFETLAAVERDYGRVDSFASAAG